MVGRDRRDTGAFAERVHHHARRGGYRAGLDRGGGQVGGDERLVRLKLGLNPRFQ